MGYYWTQIRQAFKKKSIKTIFRSGSNLHSIYQNKATQFILVKLRKRY